MRLKMLQMQMLHMMSWSSWEVVDRNVWWPIVIIYSSASFHAIPSLDFFDIYEVNDLGVGKMKNSGVSKIVGQ